MVSFRRSGWAFVETGAAVAATLGAEGGGAFGIGGTTGFGGATSLMVSFFKAGTGGGGGCAATATWGGLRFPGMTGTAGGLGGFGGKGKPSGIGKSNK